MLVATGLPEQPAPSNPPTTGTWRSDSLVDVPVAGADEDDRGAGLQGWLAQWVEPGRAGGDALEIRFAHRDTAGISVD